MYIFNGHQFENIVQFRQLKEWGVGHVNSVLHVLCLELSGIRFSSLLPGHDCVLNVLYSSPANPNSVSSWIIMVSLEIECFGMRDVLILCPAVWFLYLGQGGAPILAYCAVK